eukprot:421336_1
MFIQVGQCGNQLSEEIWTLARKELQFDSRPFPYHPWFEEECSWSYSEPSGRSSIGSSFSDHKSILYPRAIAIDTEPNVIRNVTAATGFRPENVLVGEGGGGCSNCWAAGFTEQDDLLERFMETVRRESERCHVQRGMTIVHSLGGGTGSGMGSALLALLRDDYPSTCLVNLAVSPFLHESPLQTYNCCLSLAYLAQLSDGVMLRCNSDTLSSGLQLLSSGGGNKERQSNAHRVTLRNINAMLAIDFCTLVLPSAAASPSLDSIGSLVSSVSPLPLVKFCNVQSTCSMAPLLPSTEYQLQKRTAANRRWSIGGGERVRWSDLVVPLVRRKGVGYDGAVNIATKILLRGATVEEMNEQGSSSAASMLRRTLGKGYSGGLVDISFAPVLQHHLKTKRDADAFCDAAICCNSTGIADWIHDTLKRGRGLLSSRAYCHYYNARGVEDEDFESAFEVLESTIDAYDAWRLSK